MRLRTCFVLLLGLLVCAGCTSEKTTAELIQDLKSGQEGDRISAARLLADRKGDAGQVVPALIEALEDKVPDVRWSAAIGLGYYGDQARDAIPALQARVKDPDARVREGARVAMSRIDPSLAPQAAAQPRRK
jgi:HEAT repeat protein